MNISSLDSSYLQSILSSALQKAGVTSNKTSNTTNGVDASSFALNPDNRQLSPFAQMMGTLQQLQQSDPTKYQQVTQQIATNLQAAAKTAQSDGNTTAANQLTQLANDFTNASTSGQLPNIQDLAQAIGGAHHHHHPHHAHSAPSDSSGTSSGDSNSSTGSSSSTTSANQALQQLLSAIQASGAQSDSLNPMNIILNTLSSAGVPVSNS